MVEKSKLAFVPALVATAIIVVTACGPLQVSLFQSAPTATPTSAPGQTATAIASSQSIQDGDELREVVLTVPEQFRRGPFSQARTIHLPPGFNISVFATGLGSPRFMALSPDGVLLVTVPQLGRAVALPDRDADGAADEVITFASGLNLPHGIAFYQEALYIAETNRIVRFYDRDGDLRADGAPEVIVPNLSTGGGHWTRTIAFGTDGKLYVAAGSSCNVCQERDPRRAAITRYNPDGGGEEIYAQGLRNAVGIVFHPDTEELWATDNGRDLLGDDLPPDEIDIVEQGKNYGWPQCYGNRVTDPQFGKPGFCETTQPPVAELPAHSTALGLRFYTGEAFSPEYRGDLFIAYHGSWNRSVPTGYKVVRIDIEQGKAPGPAQDFAVGWLQGSAPWGRPVDVIVGKDGALYVSDDQAGAIYRIQYKG